MKPLVSVIIPNYNHAAYLPQRIESVLGQTFRNTEIIILDDCSTDGSRDIISRYATQDSRIRTIFNTRNSGSPFRQWAKGMAEARGRYIWIAESDDYADLLFLEKIVSALEAKPAAGVAYSQSWLVDSAGQKTDSCRNLYAVPGLPGIYPGRHLIEERMAGANLIPNASAAVFRRDLALQLDDSYQNFRFSGDWWFWCQLLAVSDLIYVDEELNHFRSHPQKVTVASHRNHTFVIEKLTVIGLLRAKKWISMRTFQNKSRNAAVQLVSAQRAGTQPLSPQSIRKIMQYALRHNRVFLVQAIKCWLR